MVANQTSRVSHLPAHEVHQRLVHALAELQKAERNAVLWFAEVVRRKLYRELGFSSIYQYAELELGFKKSKTAQFLRLSESFKELPELRRSVASGELSWTKAREVAKVATPESESAWIQEAKQVPRRELERRVTEERRQARIGVSGRAQVTLEMGGVEKSSFDVSEEDTRKAVRRSPGSSGEAEMAVPVDVQVRMTAEQYARYQALMEALAKGGVAGDKAERILAGLEQLALGAAPGRDDSDPADAVNAQDDHGEAGHRDPGDAKPDLHREFTRVNSRSPYQVVVQMCPYCRRGSTSTNRGEKTLAPRELRAILCDAHIRKPGERNKAAIPNKLRRAVLERDRFTCRSAGCRSTSFLAVHHRVPREAGGANTLENLITLCSGCHRAVHG